MVPASVTAEINWEVNEPEKLKKVLASLTHYSVNLTKNSLTERKCRWLI